MTLRAKTYLIFILTLVGMVAFLYLASSTMVQKGFENLELQEAQLHLDRSLNALSDEQSGLALTTQDYATWDETYAYSETGDASYIRKNFYSDSLKRLDLNLVLVINTTGKVLYSTLYDAESNELSAIPQSLLEKVYTDSPLVSGALSNGGVTGILALPEGASLVSSHPIVSSTGKGPSRGVLVFGRFLDARMMKRLSDKVQLSLSMIDYNQEQLAKDIQTAREVLTTADGYAYIQAVDSKTVSGYSVIKDLYGSPVYIWRIDVPRDIQQQGRLNLRDIFILASITGVAITGLALIFIRRAVLTPITNLEREVSGIAGRGDFRARLPVTGENELSSLANSINRMLQALEYRTQELAKRLAQLRVVADTAQSASATRDIKELLNDTVNLLVERFGYYSTSIYLIDETREYATLSGSSGAGSEAIKARVQKHVVGSRSLVGWVAANNQVRVASDVREDPFYFVDDLMPETRSECAVPIATGNHILGVLDVQNTRPNALTPEDVLVLQAMANQIATAIQNIRLYETSQVNLEETSLLYFASRQIAQAETTEQIFQVISSALRQTPYITGIYKVDDEGLSTISLSHPPVMDTIPSTERISIPREELETLCSTGTPLLVTDFNQPSNIPYAISRMLRTWKCEEAAIVPILSGDKPAALVVLGTQEKGILTPTALQPYANLAELTATALEKIEALQRMEKRFTELQRINEVSQAIAVQTDLNALYELIHNVTLQIMGDVSFLIALYDKDRDLIQVPYMWEEAQRISVEPFPLGEGLTSILIRTRQPLMLVEDTINKARELGAKIQGAPAKSWLGVPLLVGNEAIGAMVVQDLEQEQRFSEDDRRLLSTLAAQVAIAIRNARLLENTLQVASRERQLFEVTSKIRGTIDMPDILRITAKEIGKVLKARRTSIKIGVEPAPATDVQIPVDITGGDRTLEQG
jgi:sensor domain CHASE-containing protein/GAF domain-containing protein